MDTGLTPDQVGDMVHGVHGDCLVNVKALLQRAEENGVPYQVAWAIIFATLDNLWDFMLDDASVRHKERLLLMRQMYYHAFRGNKDPAKLVQEELLKQWEAI